jgi:hypothetical protein
MTNQAFLPAGYELYDAASIAFSAFIASPRILPVVVEIFRVALNNIRNK